MIFIKINCGKTIYLHLKFRAAKKMNLAPYLEHTLLRPDTDLKSVQIACELALKNHLAGICVPPLFMRDSRRILGEGFGVPKLVTVVGFPMGYSSIASKSEEIKRAIEEGAEEIDVVACIAAIKSGNWNHVSNDIDSVARATHLKGCFLKIIFEVGLLTEQEILMLVDICVGCGVDFVKTGTGMIGQSVTVEQVKFLRAHLPENIKIKASGGVRSKELAASLIEAGAVRLGSSVALDLI
jgi:deoxyribose-phosphate aldolase